ncbi:TetR/AcrR family transcriptional regulator [Pistricoccus aurantiacus]|uniref:TetR/AcrR family transcriptional regulator n=2 Tax=Pistricoccus aurantiacus TaxID=1883414 RepID=A0A5B8SUZ0_9GAMM|nr:TetR/AcrR family transcriptional regulator [Pistricoccus aurantiacus]
MTRQRKSHETRREEIIMSALDLSAEIGTKKVTAQAIADRIGIAQPTVFRHFKNRSAIFRGAMEWIANALFGVLEGVNGDAPADERLRKLLGRQLAFIGKRRGVARLLFSDRLHLEDPELKLTVRRIMERYMGHLEAIVRDGIASGYFRRSLDPAETSRFIAATVQGLVMRWSIYDFEFPLEDQVDALWRFLEPALMAEAGDKCS